jgi:hypothetical protein
MLRNSFLSNISRTLPSQLFFQVWYCLLLMGERAPLREHRADSWLKNKIILIIPRPSLANPVA